MHGVGKVAGSFDMAWRQMYGTSKSKAFESSSLLSHTTRLRIRFGESYVTRQGAETKHEKTKERGWLTTCSAQWLRATNRVLVEM